MSEKYQLTVEEKARIEVFQQEQATASRMTTQASQNRKARIAVLFTEFEKMKIMINLYRGAETK